MTLNYIFFRRVTTAHRLFLYLLVSVFFLLPLAANSHDGQASGTDQKTILELLDEDGPLYELIYDLEECYEKHLGIVRAASQAAEAEREAKLQDFLEKLEKSFADSARSRAPKREDMLAALGRDIQRLVSEYDLQALFPGSPEERFLRCQHHLRLARMRLKTARDLNEDYRKVLVQRGADKYFPGKNPEDWQYWQEEIDTFECKKSVERPPLRTRIRIPAGARRFFVLKTFCLDRNKLGPNNGQKLKVIGTAASLGRTNLVQLLEKASTFPAREIDIQEAIWKECGNEREEGSLPGAPESMTGGGGGSPGGVLNLVDAVSSGDVRADLRIRDNFTLVDMWIENRGGTEKVIDVFGAVFGSGDADVQRTGAAGVDTEQPPPGPDINSPERTLEDIRDEVAKKLEEAMERVRNGDHSQEALKELLDAMAAARNVGLEEPLNEAWDVFRDGLWEETVDSYDSYTSDPSAANKKNLLDLMEAVRQTDPPEGKQDAFDRMREDVLGVPTP